MPDIIVAADQTAATALLHDAEATLGTVIRSGTAQLGPFGASYSASGTFSGGSVTLEPVAKIVLVADCNLKYLVSLNFWIDLNDFLPHLCLPQVCAFGICTPKICIDWPRVNVPFPFGDTVTFTAAFKLDAYLAGANWLVDVVVIGIPLLQFGAVTATILAALGLALTAALAWIPFIGPFLAAAVATIVATIGLTGIAGLLGLIVTPFVAGRRFNIYNQPQKFPVLLPAGANDPEVDVKIIALSADVQASDKSELVIAVNIAT